MTGYLHLDTDTLDALPPREAYQAATQIHQQAKRLGAAYADRLAATLAAEHGQARAADLLEIKQPTLAARVTRHKERTMPHVITWDEAPTRTPAIRTRYRDGVAEAEAITDGAVLAQISYETPEGSVVLDQLAEEIAPWLPALGALREEDQALTVATMVDREVRWHAQAEDDADERDRWAQLVGTVRRYQTRADVASAEREIDPRLDEAGREIALTLRTADAIVERLSEEAVAARGRAVEAAPGKVSGLLLWTTPKDLAAAGVPLAGWLKNRLA